LAQASEYRCIRLHSREKQLYTELNKSSAIRFPIKVGLTLPGHKISLLIQAVLGGLDPRNDDVLRSDSQQFHDDYLMVFQHAHRLIRCIIDCQLHLEDSVGARSALELARALGARAWDDSASQLQKIENIGPVSMRKLAAAGIDNIEKLENTESHKIDHILGRNPPFGAKVLEQVKGYPKLRVSLKMIGAAVSSALHACPPCHINAS